MIRFWKVDRGYKDEHIKNHLSDSLVKSDVFLAIPPQQHLEFYNREHGCMENPWRP